MGAVSPAPHRTSRADALAEAVASAIIRPARRGMGQNKPILKILRGLLTMTKTLARQEAEFRANCKKQQEDLKARILRLQNQECVSVPSHPFACFGR